VTRTRTATCHSGESGPGGHVTQAGRTRTVRVQRSQQLPEPAGPPGSVRLPVGRCPQLPVRPACHWHDGRTSEGGHTVTWPVGAPGARASVASVAPAAARARALRLPTAALRPVNGWQSLHCASGHCHGHESGPTRPGASAAARACPNDRDGGPSLRRRASGCTQRPVTGWQDTATVTNPSPRPKAGPGPGPGFWHRSDEVETAAWPGSEPATASGRPGLRAARAAAGFKVPPAQASDRPESLLGMIITRRGAAA
jgi:hypothetical protein